MSQYPETKIQSRSLYKGLFLVAVALSCPLTLSRTELHPSLRYSTQSSGPAQTDAHEPTLHRETQTNTQTLTQPQRNKQSWGQTARDPQT